MYMHAGHVLTMSGGWKRQAAGSKMCKVPSRMLAKHLSLNELECCCIHPAAATTLCWKVTLHFETSHYMLNQTNNKDDEHSTYCTNPQGQLQDVFGAAADIPCLLMLPLLLVCCSRCLESRRTSFTSS